jgi:hypothetical protein
VSSCYISDGTAKGASAGWGGDRFALYERPATSDRLLLIVIAWDSQTEAAEFASAYAAFAGEKYEAVTASEDALGTWWQGENETALLSTDEGQSIVIIGSQADAVERVRQALERIEH